MTTTTETVGGMSKIIERIKKLTALAGSSNVHEAASAAAHAARLMQEYQIEEAMLIGAEQCTDEPVEAGIPVDKFRRAPTWKILIATAIARSIGCELYTTRGVLNVIGRRSDAQAVSYLYQAVANQVDELCASGERASRFGAARVLRGETARAWCGAFRSGAAHAIWQRLEDQKAQQRAEVKGRADGGDQGSSTALAVINDRAIAVKETAKRIGLRTVTRGGSSASRDGFHAGMEAGQNVNLGQNRGSLPAPARQFPR